MLWSFANPNLPTRRCVDRVVRPKGVVTMDGKIKRSDGGDSEPPSRTSASSIATRSLRGKKSSYSNRGGSGDAARAGAAGAASGCQYSNETKHVSVHDCTTDGCKTYATLAEAMAACTANPTCGGINAGTAFFHRHYFVNSREFLVAMPRPPVNRTAQHPISVFVFRFLVGSKLD